MNLKNYKDYACFDYKSNESKLRKLGDVVIKKEDNEIGVIIQVHEEREYRTDMFGNCSASEIRLATKKEIEKYRPNLLKEGKYKEKEERYPELQAIADKMAVEIAKRINVRVKNVESEMPYKAQCVLEKLIQKLEEFV